jgi:hypothetical protein
MKTDRFIAPALVAFLAVIALSALGGVRLYAEGIEWGGSLLGTATIPEGEHFDFPNGAAVDGATLETDLHGESKPGERLRLFFEAVARATSLPRQASAFSDLSSRSALLPLEARLVEAYADLYGFPVQGIDLRVGRQRIVWGPAEKVSVIDALDAYDLEDPADFGKRLASDALKVSWYLEPVKVEGVFIPVFAPSLLPADVSRIMPQTSVAVPQPLTLNPQPAISLALPGSDLADNATLGARVSVAVAGFDIAGTYIYGRQQLPVATKITATLTPPTTVNVATELSFPRRHIAGLDVTGEIFGIGVWGEAAGFFPGYSVTTDMSGIGGQSTAETAEMYFKGVLGIDYTFPADVYLNIQYAHGFFNENASKDINDFLLLGVEWKVPGGWLKIGPVGVALEMDDFANIADSWAMVLSPTVTLYPFDNAEISAGFRWITGNTATTLGSDKASNQITLSAKLTF